MPPRGHLPPSKECVVLYAYCCDKTGKHLKMIRVEDLVRDTETIDKPCAHISFHFVFVLLIRLLFFLTNFAPHSGLNRKCHVACM